MPALHTPQELVERALAHSTSDDAVVIVTPSSSANLRWAVNTLTTNGVMRGQEVTVIAFSAKADGVASASVSGAATTTEQVCALVEAADNAAGSATPAPDAAELVGSGDRHQDVSPDWSDPPGETSIGVFGEFAPALGESFGQARSGDRILYGFVEHGVTTTYLGSTRGLRLRHEQPTGHYGCTGKSRDLTRSAWVGGATRDFSEVHAANLDATLAKRLGWATRNVPLPAGRYDTILPPPAVADLSIYAYWEAGARVAHEGGSVYSATGGSSAHSSTRIGDLIADPRLQVYSDPEREDIAAQPFVTADISSNLSSVFDNGLPLTRTDWVRDGKLTSLMQTRHTASMTNQPVTPGIDNLALEVSGATASLDQLVEDMDYGLLLTCLWYIREVDASTLLLTGLTRDGVYLVEGGEITGAVNNFRFNESPVDLWGRFTDASRTVPTLSREWGADEFSRTAMPALRVPDFNMSSVSQAQ